MPEKKDDAYNIFYMGINLGAFMSPLVASSLHNLHPITAGITPSRPAGVGMIFSLIIFSLFQSTYVRRECHAGTVAGMEIELTPQESRSERLTIIK